MVAAVKSTSVKLLDDSICLDTRIQTGKVMYTAHRLNLRNLRIFEYRFACFCIKLSVLDYALEPAIQRVGM